jgi:hypothetical protein
MYRVSRKAAADRDSQVEMQAYGWRKLLVSSQLVELKCVCFVSWWDSSGIQVFFPDHLGVSSK